MFPVHRLHDSPPPLLEPSPSFRAPIWVSPAQLGSLLPGSVLSVLGPHPECPLQNRALLPSGSVLSPFRGPYPGAVCTALLRSPGSPPRGRATLATGVSPRVLGQLSGDYSCVPGLTVAWAAAGVLVPSRAGV